jgi:3-hydroxyisobutyrate dehydrogenase-like beta-hydroxyacid dehydrogenase
VDLSALAAADIAVRQVGGGAHVACVYLGENGVPEGPATASPEPSALAYLVALTTASPAATVDVVSVAAATGRVRATCHGAASPTLAQLARCTG